MNSSESNAILIVYSAGDTVDDHEHILSSLNKLRWSLITTLGLIMQEDVLSSSPNEKVICIRSWYPSQKYRLGRGAALIS